MTNNPNNYENQKLRGLKRKYEYVVKRGGKCEHCGYDKNLSALEFHHRNPEEKEYMNIDNRSYSCPMAYAHIPASDRIDLAQCSSF